MHTHTRTHTHTHTHTHNWGSNKQRIVNNNRTTVIERILSATSHINCIAAPGGGGGYSNFYHIRRLGPSIYRSPQKIIRNFKHPKKIFEILATQKNIPILYLDLKKKTLNCIEMTLKLAQFCGDPKKISTISSYPKKILIFLKTQKNIEIQNFKPKKMDRAYVYVKIAEYPLGLLHVA